MAECQSTRQDQLCVLCTKDITYDAECDIVTLGKKGSDGINRASEERGSSLQTQEGQRVHKACRKNWCNPNYIKTHRHVGLADASVPEFKRRSQSKPFDFTKDCIFCCQQAHCDGRRRGYDAFLSGHQFLKTLLEVFAKYGMMSGVRK